MFRSLASVATLASLLSVASAQDTWLQITKLAFQMSNITNTVGINFDPALLLEVAYPQSPRSALRVDVGDTVDQSVTDHVPYVGVKFPHCRDCLSKFPGPYVLAMIDLDAPTPQSPTDAQLLHLLQGNLILTNSDRNGLSFFTNYTPAVMEYTPPSPPAGSDPHRYVFLLYSQPAQFNNQSFVSASTERTGFNLTQFAQEVGLGDPLGGTYMLVGPSFETSALNGSASGSSDDSGDDSSDDSSGDDSGSIPNFASNSTSTNSTGSGVNATDPSLSPNATSSDGSGGPDDTSFGSGGDNSTDTGFGSGGDNSTDTTDGGSSTGSGSIPNFATGAGSTATTLGGGDGSPSDSSSSSGAPAPTTLGTDGSFGSFASNGTGSGSGFGSGSGAGSGAPTQAAGTGGAAALAGSSSSTSPSFPSAAST